MFTGRKYSINFVPPRAASTTHGWIVVLGVSLVFVRKFISEIIFKVIT